MTCRRVSAPTLISKIVSQGQVLNGALTVIRFKCTTGQLKGAI